jgi:hypothetical protein
VRGRNLLRLLALMLAVALGLGSATASIARPGPVVSSVTWQEQRFWQQYYDRTPLEVAISLVNRPGDEDRVPIRISGVWNNRTNYNLWRNQPDAFVARAPNIVHGYIDEANPDAVPRYRFVGTNWFTNAQAAQAKQQIVQAFDEWSALQAVRSPVTGQLLSTGLEFKLVEASAAVPEPAAEIQLYWQALGAGEAAATNRLLNEDGTVSQINLTFNAANNWWFGTAATTPPTQMHFYSSSLHELGHLVGLWESNQPSSVMIYKRNPGPNGPAFDHLDEASKRMAYALYSRPRP